MNRKVLAGLSFLLAGLLTIAIFWHVNPRKKMKYADYESAHYYLGFYNNVMDEDTFQELVTNLIRNTNDVTILNNLTIYLKHEQKCIGLSELEKKCLMLESFPSSSALCYL